MSGLVINITLDKYNKALPKPINIALVMICIMSVRIWVITVLDVRSRIEREYDTLSVVKPGQSLVAWAGSVQIWLQELLAG